MLIIFPFLIIIGWGWFLCPASLGVGYIYFSTYHLYICNTQTQSGVKHRVEFTWIRVNTNNFILTSFDSPYIILSLKHNPSRLNPFVWYSIDQPRSTSPSIPLKGNFLKLRRVLWLLWALPDGSRDQSQGEGGNDFMMESTEGKIRCWELRFDIDPSQNCPNTISCRVNDLQLRKEPFPRFSALEYILYS